MTYYTVKITQHSTVQRRSKDWVKVADTGNPKDNGAVYDYAYSDESYAYDVPVYEQRLDELSLVKVIAAVNGLEL